MESDPYFILISAGGTGGHMSPAAALASDLKTRGHRVELVTDDRGLKFLSMFKEVKHHVVKSGTLGSGVIGKIKGMINLALGIPQGFALIQSLKPDLVIGFGGYPSFPAVYAAQKFHIPTIIHEQNSLIGKANLLLAPQAERIALSFKYMGCLEREDTFRTVITGNPIRSDIAMLHEYDYEVPKAGEDFNIFVMGGSLGATVLSEVVPKALAGLPDADRVRLRVTQQCREADIESARHIYDQAGVRVYLKPFIDDVASVLGSAHLVIARSGASTVAEVSAAGVPAIYVPYPHHKDQQQLKNAESVFLEGGAWILEEKNFTETRLREKIEAFLKDPKSLSEAAGHAKSCGRPNAAKRLGNLVIAVVKEHKRIKKEEGL
ncbi:MAG: undecaprenyldiphospho-muramoylpentapeptide beta-N-acetylglucosaminyltransferase [Alphaproteobacteria bacterium]|nr:undecaprenyldiphospho-muramoylpentapeptide beta-N-acetylglucosaminyltransferase [Alphaproteobacteria bacterium]